MKIVYCCWNENSAQDALNNLKKYADEVISITRNVKEYLDGSVIKELAELLTKDVDAVFSHDFFPIVSDMCKVKEIPYISVVYDWPNYTLFNPSVYNSCNKIYLFDCEGIRMLERYRVNNLHYMPLSVDTERLDKLLGTDIEGTGYRYDVSFVGNMYLNKQEALFMKEIPAYYSGFVDALVNAQQKVYGYNLVNDIVNKEFTKKYLETIQGNLAGMNVPEEFVLATQINRLITGSERKELLNKAASRYSVHLFTHSPTEELKGVKVHGGVDYTTEMPRIFRQSKINLNITLRSITSGVPLRVFDILGAGGFCLTNYQECIMEHFENGKELVMYGSAEEMLDMIDYYLAHEDERLKIAKNGHEKVKEFSYEAAYKKIFVKEG